MEWSISSASFCTSGLVTGVVVGLVLHFVFWLWSVLHAAHGTGGPNHAAETGYALDLAEFIHSDGAEDEHDCEFLWLSGEDEQAARFAVNQLDHDVGRFAGLALALFNHGRPLGRVEGTANLLNVFHGVLAGLVEFVVADVDAVESHDELACGCV